MTKLNPFLPSNIQSFSEASITHHVGKPNRVGRSFTINFTNETGNKISTTVKFKELVDHFRKLSKQGDREDSIKQAYSKLKIVNQDANRILRKQSGWYKFRTSIHQLSNIFRKDHDFLLDRTLTKKSIDLPKTTTWHDEIIAKIPDYNSLAGFSRSVQIDKANSIANTYQNLAAKHPDLKLMGTNLSGGKSMISFTMQGLSIIASYLKQKHHLENLYVCDSLDAFQDHLRQIANSDNDTRASFVIPLKEMGKQFLFVPDNQHKATIGVEKKDGKLKIIYLDGDPQPIQNDLLNKSPLELKDLVDGGFSAPVFWCISQCHLKGDVELFHSTVKREYGPYGCETIALRDAVGFLKYPNFFEKIKFKPDPSIPEIAEVNFLPACFMKTTQSRTALKRYMKDNPSEATAPIETARSGSKTLEESLKSNTKTGYGKSGARKKQNHYVSFKSYKYHTMALEAMNTMTSDELKTQINETFISIKHPEMQREPQNLHDLYTHFWNT